MHTPRTSYRCKGLEGRLTCLQRLDKKKESCQECLQPAEPYSGTVYWILLESSCQKARPSSMYVKRTLQGILPHPNWQPCRCRLIGPALRNMQGCCGGTQLLQEATRRTHTPQVLLFLPARLSLSLPLSLSVSVSLSLFVNVKIHIDDFVGCCDLIRNVADACIVFTATDP